MSLDYNEYDGPFIYIERPKETIHNTMTFSTCHNSNCKDYGHLIKTNYCSNCGSKIEEKPFTKTHNLDWFDILKPKDDKGFIVIEDLMEISKYLDNYQQQKEYPNILISNRSKFFTDNFFFEECNIKELTSNSNKDELEEFKKMEAVQKVIEYANKHNLNYEFSYGKINYIS